MDEKEVLAMGILLFIGAAISTGCYVFIQYQSSKVSIMSNKTANQSQKTKEAAVDDNIIGNNSDNDKIKNFEECVAAGNPVSESYPVKCQTQDEKIFTENIGNEMELLDLIKTYSPRPNAKITSPLTITGQARGNWFFEALFFVELTDVDNNKISYGIAQAQDDWMTKDFVDFLAIIEFTAPQTPTGNLILRKDNPSGLPENDNQLIVPVKF